MDSIKEQLTVLFEDPFWIGIVERYEEETISVCKITFGAEPKDYEVMEFIIKRYDQLRFSPAVTTVVKETAVNPKRRIREAKKQTLNRGIGTKAQQALKLQQEQNKTERKRKSKERKELEQQIKFERKNEKRKMKHRGH